MTREEAVAALDEYRDQIDEMDRRLIELLNERTRVVEQIGRVKTRDADCPFTSPSAKTRFPRT